MLAMLRETRSRWILGHIWLSSLSCNHLLFNNYFSIQNGLFSESIAHEADRPNGLLTQRREE